MAGVLKIEIAESADTLKQVLQQQQEATQRSKVQVLWWLKTGKANRVNQLAELSGYHRTTVSRWLSQYRQGGLETLLEVHPKPGRPAAIAGNIRQRLQQELEKPEGFGSYKEIQEWLQTVCGVQIPYKTVHKTVRYSLKAELKQSRATPNS
ncbi:MAG: helix-turn-helix domain-containing protein [Cyanobacteria bacterium P01_F01_bin.86]